MLPTVDCHDCLKMPIIDARKQKNIENNLSCAVIFLQLSKLQPTEQSSLCILIFNDCNSLWFQNYVPAVTVFSIWEFYLKMEQAGLNSLS